MGPACRGTPPCPAAYLSRPDATELQSGYIDYSIPTSGPSGTRWYVDGNSYQEPKGDWLIAAEQCIR